MSTKGKTSTLPPGSELAAMVRTGKTPQALADRYGVAAGTVRQRMRDSGYSTYSTNGQPQKTERTGGLKRDGDSAAMHHVGGRDVPTPTLRPFVPRPKPAVVSPVSGRVIREKPVAEGGPSGRYMP